MNTTDANHEYIYNVSAKINMNNMMFKLIQCNINYSTYFHKFYVENMGTFIDESTTQISNIKTATNTETHIDNTTNTETHIDNTTNTETHINDTTNTETHIDNTTNTETIKKQHRLPVFAILGKGCSPVSEPKSSKRKFSDIST